MNSKRIILAIGLVLTLPAFAQQPDMSLIPYRQGDLWGYAILIKALLSNLHMLKPNGLWRDMLLSKREQNMVT